MGCLVSKSPPNSAWYHCTYHGIDLDEEELDKKVCVEIYGYDDLWER